jgi:IMP dehydrogenase
MRHATRRASLRVGAAVGVGEGTEERVEALVEAGVDAIVVDTAHGHSQGVIERVRWVKQNYPHVDVVGGNIATGAAALALVEAGADACQGRHWPRLDLHHPHRGWCGRAANHGH